MKKACTERTCGECNRTSRSGFTLVEVLVVMGVLSIVGVLVLIIFSQSLKGTNKSQILISIKQNGQSVLESMTSVVRNADNIVCPAITPPATSAPPSPNLVIVSKGIYTRYRFIPQIAGSNSNGLIQQDNPVKQMDPATGKEETDSVFVNRVCVLDNPMINPIVLTDTNVQNGVSLKSGSFIRERPAGFKEGVKINFSLGPAVQALPSVAGQIDDVVFETTIQLR